jgi:nucleotide-binding universal stress UspA family protein
MRHLLARLKVLLPQGRPDGCWKHLAEPTGLSERKPAPMDNCLVPRPRVIVGVDRSLHGLAALRAAAAEAARRDAPLYAVRVQSEMLIPLEDREIDAALDEALGGPPRGVELHRELAVPPVVTALVNLATCSGDLLVVGRSERRGWRRLRPGSVAHGCLSRAYCAVLAVPAPEMSRTVWRWRGLWPHRVGDLWRQFTEETPSIFS